MFEIFHIFIWFSQAEQAAHDGVDYQFSFFRNSSVTLFMDLSSSN